VADFGIHCLINKPTRIIDHSSTLLNHLYTNGSRITIHSGICIWNVSDHYPIFCIIPSTKSNQKCKKLYARDTTLFETEVFLDELQRNMETLQIQDVNTTFSRFALLFETTLNKHAPLKMMSRKQQRMHRKPLISKGILKSIKTKNKLFSKIQNLDKTDSNKWNKYKKYRNKLNHIIEYAKMTYFKNQIA